MRRRAASLTDTSSLHTMSYERETTLVFSERDVGLPEELTRTRTGDSHAPDAPGEAQLLKYNVGPSAQRR